MQTLQNHNGKSKGNGAAPSFRHHDPAPTAVKFQRLVGHLHALGPRPVAELLTELVGTDEQARSDVFCLLEKYRGLDPALVRALGGNDFALPPIHAVVDR